MKTWKKLGLLTALYLSQGLPFGFFTQALPAWMRQQGFGLAEVGLTSLLALPWACKFLWAPLVDATGWRRLGRRRSWILPLQAASALALAGLAISPELADGSTLAPLMAGILLINLLAATQDIATDGLAVQLLAPAERGLGNGIQVAGYRVGMILGGGVLLVLFERAGWTWTFLAMAGLLLLAALPAAAFPEPRILPAPSRPAGGDPRAWLRASAGWFARPGAGRWVAALLLYKAGDNAASHMARPMMIDLGLDLADLGLLIGGAGFTAGLLGALLGGFAAGRIGHRRALLAFGGLQALAASAYVLPALGFGGRPLLYTICAAEHFAGGMATAALFTAMMGACRPNTEGSDYTLQASLVVIASGAAGAAGGFGAAALGYAGLFALAGVASLAGALLAGWTPAPRSVNALRSCTV